MVQPAFPSRRRVDTAGRRPAPRWIDVLLLCLIAAVSYGIVRAAARSTAPITSGAQIDLAPSHLPLYAGLSTLRMAIAYVISLVFGIVCARVAAASRTAERFMLPLLDILQSIPILSFMPGVVLGLVALIPGRVLGLELAAIVLIFTSQAWNLAFSFHQSLLTIPAELREASTVYRLGFWRRFTRLELPFGAISLIANSMMSWAGGWFFLMASEQFSLGRRNLRLPGIGSYLQVAAERGDMRALTLGLLTLVVVIVLLDQLLWRPLVAWSDLFKLEQSGAVSVAASRVLDTLRSSALIKWLFTSVLHPVGASVDRALSRPWRPRRAARALEGRRRVTLDRVVVAVLAAASVALVLWGAIAAIHVLAVLPAHAWALVAASAGATFLRTTIALVIAAAWTIPVGVAIGMHPRWAARAQPIVQVIASVPATALFPVLLLVLLEMPGGLDIAAVVLMLLGTQWYVLFNVIAGAMAIPSDLREAAATYRITGAQRWRTLILPAIFPYLVTGMITATGGAWNASIVSEFVMFGGHQVSTIGLGALIAASAERGDFALLLAGTLVMSAIVIVVNRLVWRRLYRLAELRYRLD